MPITCKLATYDTVGGEIVFRKHSKSTAGFIISWVVIPLALAAYLSWFVADFYVAGRNVVTKTETNQFGANVLNIKLRCIAQSGCYWVQAGSLCQPVLDGQSDGASRAGRFCYWTASNEVLDITKTCLLYSSDPIDAFTVGWLANDPTAAGGFGVEMVSPSVDAVTGRILNVNNAIKLYLGVSLLSWLKREDPRYLPTTINQLSPSVVSLDGTARSTFLCMNPGATDCATLPSSAQGLAPGCTAMTPGRNTTNFVQMQLRPYPLYTTQTVTIETPWVAIFGIVGGLYSLLQVGGSFALKVRARMASGVKTRGTRTYYSIGRMFANP